MLIPEINWKGNLANPTDIEFNGETYATMEEAEAADKAFREEHGEFTCECCYDDYTEMDKNELDGGNYCPACFLERTAYRAMKEKIFAALEGFKEEIENDGSLRGNYDLQEFLDDWQYEY